LREVQVDVTLEHVLSIWWLFLWRGFAGAFVLGIVAGIFNYVTKVNLGPANFVLGMVMGFLWVPFVIRMALTKKYRGFRIVLVSQISN